MVSRNKPRITESKPCHDSRISTAGNDSSTGEHDILSTYFEQKNDCYHKEDKVSLVIDVLLELKSLYHHNHIIISPNKETPLNKIINLKEIITKVPLDVFCVDKTKLGGSFPNSPFLL